MDDDEEETPSIRPTANGHEAGVSGKEVINIPNDDE